MEDLREERERMQRLEENKKKVLQICNLRYEIDSLEYCCNTYHFFFQKKSLKLNRENCSWFSKTSSSAAIETILCFFFTERFLRLKKPY